MNRNIDEACKPLYQLNNPMGYKTFGTRKKSFVAVLVSKKSKFCVSTYFLTYFLFQFISQAYACAFISANHVIYNIGYFKQTGKNAVILI